MESKETDAAAQTEELARLYEAEAQRQMDDLEAQRNVEPLADVLVVPRAGSDAAMNLTDEHAREAEISKSLRAELFGIGSRAPSLRA